MKIVTLACLSVLGLLGSAVPSPAQAPMPQTHAPAQAPAAQPANPGRAGTGVARTERRRRTSYAACNRASHQRGLRGGKRRRFLIRCRLGYERPRQQQPAGQGVPLPPMQGARP